ncbi:hypothetical protein EJ04DRAFT_610380 [Polyplosphaeria fusca]|uniref:Uncharacterized protein n=1 Tax=Polyplosphaeria fusca TaxID=682080 RepID=A0A9P4V020_9PLEO|nr:hypothetical protein EJ04DRAFT_610380 [Polyplosphaeria fusca]
MTKSVVVANLPQLIVSAAYFLYNSSLTCMLLTRECNNYAVQRKPLRVSRPEGVQRSTFWLQLPYRFGIPLMTASTILHLLVSQSFFAQSFSTHTSNGSVDNDRSVSGVLWSPTALLVTIIFSGVVLLFLMVICALEYSLFSVKVFMPISASCSAAISAACHRSVRDGTDAARLPLKYGVLSGQSNEGFRRLGFSSSEVEPLVDGEAYR